MHGALKGRMFGMCIDRLASSVKGPPGSKEGFSFPFLFSDNVMRWIGMEHLGRKGGGGAGITRSTSELADLVSMMAIISYLFFYHRSIIGKRAHYCTGSKLKHMYSAPT